jgi:hypothetical protein
MSQRRRVARRATRMTQEFSIARALHSLSGKDEAAVCAFIAETEQRRRAGDCLGWRILVDTNGVELGVLYPEGSVFGRGETISAAVHDISQQLIALGLGAPVGHA